MNSHSTDCILQYRKRQSFFYIVLHYDTSQKEAFLKYRLLFYVIAQTLISQDGYESHLLYVFPLNKNRDRSIYYSPLKSVFLHYSVNHYILTCFLNFQILFLPLLFELLNLTSTFSPLITLYTSVSHLQQQIF